MNFFICHSYVINTFVTITSFNDDKITVFIGGKIKVRIKVKLK